MIFLSRPIKGGGGILLVYLQPGASRDEIVGVFQDRLKIKIKARPIDGEANRCLVEFLSEKLGISKKHLNLIKGLQSRKKDIFIDLQYEEVFTLLSQMHNLNN